MAEPALFDRLAERCRAKLAGQLTADDGDKVATLLTYSDEDQVNIACRIGMGCTWDIALAECTPIHAPDVTLNETSRLGTIEERDVASLKPNTLNGTVFLESLADDSILELARDIERHGLRNPVEISLDGTIVEGERRWRAVGRLGWETVPTKLVVLAADEDTVAEYVLDAFSANRRPTVRERVNVFVLASTVLAKRHGRGQGRPTGKDPRSQDLFWEAEKIRDEAAKRAGLGSYELARRARKVIESGDADLVAELEAGRVSVSAAYEQLKGPALPEPVAQEPEQHAQEGNTSALEPRAATTTSSGEEAGAGPEAPAAGSSIDEATSAAGSNAVEESDGEEPPQSKEAETTSTPEQEGVEPTAEPEVTTESIKAQIQRLLDARPDNSARLDALGEIGRWIVKVAKALKAEAANDERAEEDDE